MFIKLIFLSILTSSFSAFSQDSFQKGTIYDQFYRTSYCKVLDSDIVEIELFKQSKDFDDEPGVYNGLVIFNNKSNSKRARLANVMFTSPIKPSRMITEATIKDISAEGDLQIRIDYNIDVEGRFNKKTNGTLKVGNKELKLKCPFGKF